MTGGFFYRQVVTPYCLSYGCGKRSYIDMRTGTQSWIQHMNDLFDTTIMATDTDVASGAAGGIETHIGLSELDHALADWARRHGASPLVAHAFALAHWAVTQGHSCLPLDAIPTALMPVQQQRELKDA